MSEPLSTPMWAMIFRMAEGRTMLAAEGVSRRTLDALDRRGLLEDAPGGGRMLNDRGWDLVDRVKNEVRV